MDITTDASIVTEALDTSLAVNDVGSTDAIVRAASIVLGAVGTLANGFVLLVILSFTQMRHKVQNYFIINQVAVDLACSLLTIATYATKSVSYDRLSQDAQEIACKLWFSTLPLWAFLTSSTYNLVILTAEKYFKVVHPLAHKANFSKKKAKVAMFLVWSVGFVWHGATLIPTTHMVAGACFLSGDWPSPELQRFYGILNVILMFLLPVGLQLFCYACIVRVLRQRNNVVATSSTASQGDKMSRAQRNVIKLSVLLSLCYFLCWTCNQVLYLLFTCGVAVDFSGWFYHFTVVTVFFNSCINPAIYILKYDEFKAGMRKAFSKNSVEPTSEGSTHFSS